MPFKRLFFDKPSSVLIACFALFISVGACSQEVKIPQSLLDVKAVSEEENIVRAFIDAFSAHDVERMTSLCAEDIVWRYFSADDLGKADQAGMGIANLRTEMEAYFKATPTVRSEIENMAFSGAYVSVVERVYWQTSNPEGDERTDQPQTKTQSAVAVYHVKDQKIRSVWYYPAQP